MATISQTFPMQLLEWKSINFDYNFTEVYHKWSSINKYSSIGSDNGLLPIRWQAIVWTIGDYITDAYVHHLVLMR